MNVIKLTMLAGAFLVAVSASYGSSIISQEDWSGGDAEGWTIVNEPGSAGAGYGSIDGSGTDLQIDSGLGTEPAPTDFIRIDQAPAVGDEPISGFIGDYGAANVQGIYFDFFVDPDNSALPSSLQLYFVYNDGQDHVWFWSLSSSLTTGWSAYGANFNPAGPADIHGLGQWYQMPQYGDGLTGTWGSGNITEIGIALTYLTNIDDQIYAIDNFTLSSESYMIPEPETYAFIAMALLSLAFVYRKRLEDQLELVKAYVQRPRLG